MESSLVFLFYRSLLWVLGLDLSRSFLLELQLSLEKRTEVGERGNVCLRPK